MADGYLIGADLLGRIRRTVDAAEAAPMRLQTGRIAVRLEGEDGAAPGKAFRICTFTGSWAIGAPKTLTFKYQTTTPNTASAINLFCGLSPSGSCDVSIAKDGTAWYLIQPNLTQLPGYSSGGTQVLTVVGGNLRWVGTTSC